MNTNVYDRHLDARTMLWDAASMYLSSPTAHGRSGFGTRARRVAKQLKKEMGEGDLSYEDGNKAYVDKDTGEPIRIAIDYRLSNSLAGTSIRLVHEALHFWVHGHTITEEFAARRLEVTYFHDLLTKRWHFLTRSGQRKWSVRLRRGDPVDKSLQLTDMEHFDKCSQLVDYILYMPTYAETINANWVKETLKKAYWGGITNRWPETRGLYVAILAREGGLGNARVVKQIVKSLLELDRFNPLPEYRSHYTCSNDFLKSFALSVDGRQNRSESEQGWQIVRKALKPLLRDSSERRDLEQIERQLSRPLEEIHLTRAPGPPRPPEL